MTPVVSMFHTFAGWCALVLGFVLMLAIALPFLIIVPLVVTMGLFCFAMDRASAWLVDVARSLLALTKRITPKVKS